MELGSFGLIPDVFISDFALFLFPGGFVKHPKNWSTYKKLFKKIIGRVLLGHLGVTIRIHREKARLYFL